MLKVDKDDLEKMINDIDDNEDITVKKKLKNMINELFSYNESVIKNISDKIIKESDPMCMGEIVSGLILDSEKEKFFELFPEVDYTSEIEYPIFINEDYEKVREIIGDTAGGEKLYEGKYIYKGQTYSFKYKLKFNNCFLKKERIIKELDKYYALNNPIIFSPYGRKAVNIMLMEKIPPNVELNYQFEENGLNILKNRILVWNLRITETDYRVCNKQVPYGDEIKYHFIIEKADANSWYYILPENNQTLVYDVRFTEKGTEIWIDHEMEKFQLIEWKKVDRDKVEIKDLVIKNNLYSNYVEKNSFTCKRVNSLGDIQYAIRPFRENMNIRCNVSDKEGEPYLRYSVKYRNNVGVKMKTLRNVFLEFEFLEDFKYKSDYVNYVLTYLEYYFPEIEWIGEK